jgi:16S rRNA processing protein RimM
LEDFYLRYFEIGTIVNTQGIKGDVRVLPLTDDPTRFELLSEIETFTKDKSKIYKIDKVRYHKQFVILKLNGIDSINDAQVLKGTIIKVTEDNAIPLNNDEYYIRDLYGIDVITDSDEKLGTISDILFTNGANDVYIIKTKDSKEILIPAIKQCILNVDIAKRVMTVNLLEGLI